MDNNSQVKVQTSTTDQQRIVLKNKTTVDSKDRKVELEKKKVKSKGSVGLLRPRKRIRYIRFTSQVLLLLILNFTVIGSLWVSPVLPILRFPKFWDMPWLGTGVPLCSAGSVERSMTFFWEFSIIIVILAMLFLICILIGRALCGWACPVGWIQDMVTRGERRLKFNGYEPPIKTHNKMKVIKYAILFIVMALSVSIGLAFVIDEPMGEEYRNSFDPMCQASPTCLGCPTPVLRYIFVDVGYNFDPNLDNPSNIFQLSVFIIFIIGIIAIPRFWCRYLCPVGALASLFNKVSFLHLAKDQSKCTRCNYCVDVCHTRVESIMTESEQARIGDTSCTFCGECIEACPEKALTINFGDKVLYRGGGEWWEKKKGKAK